MLVKSERREALARLRGVDLVLVGAVLGATVLRLWRLGEQSFWYDEWMTTVGVQGNPVDVLEHVANREGTGPTYFYVMWAWVRVFGESEFGFRLFSALCGIATVPVAYRAVRAFGLSRLTARTVALVVAVHPMLIWYSQEARAYSLLALLSAVSLLTLAWARDEGTTRAYVLWGLTCAVAVSVHNFAAFLFACEAIVLLAAAPARRRQFAWGAAPVATTLLLLAPVSLEQASHKGNSTWISRFPLSERLTDALEGLLVGPNPPVDWLWMPVAAVVALAAVLLVVATPAAARWTGVATAAIGLGATVLATLVTSVVGPDVLVGRYLITTVVPLVVAVGIGLTASRLRPRAGALVAGAAVVVFGAVALTTVVTVGSDPEMHKADWGSVAAVFADGDGGGEGGRALVMNRHGLMAYPLRYYLDEPDGMRRLRPEQTAEVQEIDVLVAKPTDRPCTFLIGRECALVFLGGPLPPDLAGDFTLYETVELEQFVLQRYRSDEPVAVTAAAVVAPADPKDALVIVTGA